MEQFLRTADSGSKGKRDDPPPDDLATVTKKVAHTQLIADDWLADDILALDHGELLTSCDRAIAQHQGHHSMAMKQGNNNSVQVIDQRGNNGTINLNLGSLPHPIVLED